MNLMKRYLLPFFKADGFLLSIVFGIYLAGIIINLIIDSEALTSVVFYVSTGFSLVLFSHLGFLLFKERQSRRGLLGIVEEKANQLTALMNSLPDMVWICDGDGKYRMVNKVIMDELDLPEEMITGKSPKEVWDDEIAQKLIKDDRYVLRDKRTVRYEHTFIDTKRNRGWLAITKTPVFGGKKQIMGYVGIARDITREKDVESERKELESQLRQSQKMEAIGTLAGGIAHDFNNILAAIMGYSEISLSEIPGDHPIYKRLERILKASHRGKDLVNQILTFSRQHEHKKQLVKMELVIDEALALLRPLIPSNIEISCFKCSDPCMIHADPTKIHQVLMNLCTNAAYAMRESGGKLDVRLENYKINEKNARAYGGLSRGDYVMLTVSDTGPGIDPRVKNRVFEPFYTTKKQGEGTGMGLSVVHGIIKSLNGSIALASEPDKGATFQVLIPQVRESLEEETPRIPLLSQGNERILFVDDEEPIVEMAHEMLERLGYDVTSVKNSIEALALFRRNANAFHLVVTDLTMPNMTGEELAKEMLRIRADIPIIMCTGFSEVVPAEKAKEIGIKEYIMKPFLNRELAVAIRKVLDHPIQ